MPAPNNDFISGANGNWYTNKRVAYNPTDIPNNTSEVYYASLNLINNIDYLIKSGTMLDIADAIRTQIGTINVMTPSDMASEIPKVYEAGKAYAYNNPQTPTDGRTKLKLWYGYLNAELNDRWDQWWDDQTGEIHYPVEDETTWLDSLEYPQGTSRVTNFEQALTTLAWDEAIYSYDITGIPTKKFTGVLNLEAATNIHLLYGVGAKVRDAGTIILPKSLDIEITRYSFGLMYNLKTIRFVGTIQYDFGIWDSPLDGDTIRHIVSILSDSTTGKTLTLSESTVEGAMPWEFWDELVATKPNWTFALA